MSGIRVSARIIVATGSLPYVALHDPFTYNVWRVIDGVPTDLTGYSGEPGWSEKLNPVMLPNGSQVVYTEQNVDDFLWSLWVVPSTGGTPVLVKETATDTEPLMHAYWHPNGTHFLYTQSTTGEWGGDIRKINPDGSGDTLIKAAAAGQQFYRPQYNADGTLIVYARKVTAGSVYTLRVMNADGTGDTSIRTLVNYAADGSQYTFANTTDRIAFFDGWNGTNGECYTVDPDGTNLTQISPTDTNCRISKYAWRADDSAVLGTSFTDAPGLPAENQWFTVTMDPAGGPTMTVLNDTNFLGIYPSRRSAWFWDGRLYFLEKPTSGLHPKLLVSILPDGTGYQVEHDASTSPVNNVFAEGQGPEYI